MFPPPARLVPQIGAGFPESQRYRVVDHIAVGGTSLLMRVHDTQGDRPAAIKLLLPHMASHEIHLARFAQEEAILRRLQHPNIVHVFDSGVDGEQPWFAMDYLGGGSAARVLAEQGAWPAEKALLLALDALDGLDYAHRLGIVHRDVKPDNILLDADGTALLVDFGIAQHPERRLTMVGDAMGTPAFMSPEQHLDPHMVDERTDIYGIGAVLYALVTADNPMPLAMARPTREAALDGLPPHLREVVRWATEPRPADRPPTAEALADATEDALEQEIERAIARSAGAS